MPHRRGRDAKRSHDRGLTRWLEQVELGEHAQSFIAQGIDWDVLADLWEQDSRELGLSLGDRKRLLKALATLTQPRRGEAERAEAPRSSAGAYANFMMDDEGEACVKAAYGDNYERLAMLKKKYDPTNLFRVNQNIRPAP